MAASPLTADQEEDATDNDMTLLCSAVKKVMREEVVGWMEAWRKELRRDLLAIGTEFQDISHRGTENILAQIQALEVGINGNLMGLRENLEMMSPSGFDHPAPERSRTPAPQSKHDLTASRQVGPGLAGSRQVDPSAHMKDVSLVDYTSLAHVSKKIEALQTGEAEELHLLEKVLIALTIVSAIVLGLEASASMAARKERTELHPIFAIIDWCLVVCFCLQLLARFRAEGNQFFHSGRRWWNLFDTVTILLDLFARLFDTQNPSLLRMIRLVRLTRLAAMLRFSGVVNSLRLTVQAFESSLVYLVWCSVLQLVMFYALAIFVLENITSFQIEYGLHHDDLPQDIQNSFGNMSKCVGTFFKVLLGGVLWEDVRVDLSYIGWSNSAIFCVWLVVARFLLFTTLAASLSSVINKARRIEQQGKAECLRRDSNMMNLDRMLASNCPHGDRQLDLDRLDELIQAPEMQALLRNLHIDERVLRSVFCMLDIDGTGQVPLSDLLSCIPQSNEVVDVLTLRFETRRLSMRLGVISSEVATILGILSRRTL